MGHLVPIVNGMRQLAASVSLSELLRLGFLSCLYSTRTPCVTCQRRQKKTKDRQTYKHAKVQTDRQTYIQTYQVVDTVVLPARNAWPVLLARLASSTRARKTSSPPFWCVIGFVVRCSACVQVVDVGMCVCGAACSARWGVLQRRHSFDAFLKRLGKRQSQELVRHWIRTSTRNSLSDDSPCGHLRVP